VAVVVLVKQVAMVALEVLVAVALIAGQVLGELELLVKGIKEVVQLQVLVNMSRAAAVVQVLLETQQAKDKAEMVELV
jgi:hypothetical protein